VSFFSVRRGSVAALAVGVAILALYVALQPGPRPEAVEVVATTTTVLPTTTLNAGEELCRLAREFEEGARGQDVAVVARLAESFYDQARVFAPAEIRPEYEAAARYYIEYNDIGEQYGYDFEAAYSSRDGQRWGSLIFTEPLGVNPARQSAAFQCQVELPPAPTITTTTTTRPRTTLPPETTAPATGATTPSTPPASSPPASTAAPSASPAPG
jgi:hypothetical protein